jgi:hypothetical protein
MSDAPHHLRAIHNGMDSIGRVYGEFFSQGSASGPLAGIYEDCGVLTVGTELRLPYNYSTGEYATRTGGWRCTVKRINAKSVTVTDPTSGLPFRVEL